MVKDIKELSPHEIELNLRELPEKILDQANKAVKFKEEWENAKSIAKHKKGLIALIEKVDVIKGGKKLTPAEQKRKARDEVYRLELKAIEKEASYKRVINAGKFLDNKLKAVCKIAEVRKIGQYGRGG